MTTRKVIEDYYRFLKERNREKLLALLSPEIKIIYHAENSKLPWAGEYEGMDGFDRFFDVISAYLDIVEISILNRLYDGNKAAVQCQGIWRLKSGRALISGGMINFFTVENHQLTRYEVYADTAAFESALRETGG